MKNGLLREKTKIFFAVKDFKFIFKLTLPIFIQTLFFSIISLIGSLAVSFYQRVYHIDGSYNGYYFYAISKIITVYKILVFIPIIYQLGVLVVASNLYGQNKVNKIPQVISSAIYISLILNFICYFIMFGISPIILSKAGARESAIYGWTTKENYEIFKSNLSIANNNQIPIHILTNGGTFDNKIFANSHPIVLVNNELEFAQKFLRISTLDIFIVSIAYILTSALQSIEKNKFAIVGVIAAIFFRTIWTYSILLIPKEIDLMILISLETIIGGLIQLFVAYIFVNKLIIQKQPKIPFKLSWNSKYIKEVLKIGAPIAIETGIWFTSQYFIAASIPYAISQDKFIGIWRAVNNGYDVFNSFTLALGYVTSVIVAVEIGKQDFNRAHSLGRSAFKLGLYAQIIFSILGITMTYPMLAIYSIDKQLIDSLGYSIMAIFMVKAIFDVGNLTILRGLWGANDVWMPILVALTTMIGLQLSTIYFVGIYQNTSKASTKLSAETYIIIISLIALVDPIARSTLFNLRWNSRVWQKYAKRL
ncbi:hypothetical protein DA803_02930 [[Mycoplasma] phocae]|uniref:Probable multidrug resistance protein NorM n=1 Tax=[Mycoplasma] phocae TaxID=142651 RepID=A0A2Z5IQA5_9BACT|nr:MATE family efflux transporter [[Mycoplasma] phocae]AXE61023.1 hypothetical protein DA803_02930 [[Mycoplasma] phocae]